MRLTLRTLLAYLDDLLEPAETKEIGEKIKNSKETTDLIAHIQEVIRRRRLTAPEIEGPDAGLDPNTVAEYLNNTLPAEQVVDVEKIFLESDVHLAEVAATQQIMTQVLGDPIEPSQEMLERLYALLPSTKDSTFEKGAVKNGQPVVAATSANDHIGSNSDRIDPSEKTISKPKSFEDGIPDYLKGPPIGKRILKYGAIAALLLLWVGLLWYGSGLLSESNSNSAIDDQVALGESQEFPTADTNISSTRGNKVTPQNPPSVNDKTENPVAQKPPVVVDKKPMQPVIAEIPTVVAIVSVKPVVPADKKMMDAEVLQYTSNTGILLRLDDKKSEWFVMPSRAMLQTNETFATPQPFSSTIKVGDGLVEMTLLGQTTIRTLSPTLKTAWGISLVEGHVLIETYLSKESFPKKGISIRLTSHQKSWLLKITDPETSCGINVLPIQPTSLEHKVSANSYYGKIYVATGSIQITDAEGTALDLTMGSSTPLIASFSKAKEAGDNKKGTRTLPPLTTQPEWLEYTKTAPSQITRKYARLFEKEFDIDQSVSMTVPPLLSDHRPKIAELSVLCLSLTRNVPVMVQALAQSEHEEARLAAMNGLRNWLGTTPDTSEKLKQELAKVFSSDDAAAVYRLLWGYSKDDATDKDASTQLVIWLANNHVVIRELAFHYVQQLAGQKHNYHPLGSSSQRSTALRRWQNHVVKNGGLQKK